MNEDQQYDAAEREMDLYRAEITRITAARDEYRDNAVLHVRERDQAREVLAEVLAWLENPAIDRPGPPQISEWRERARMEES